MRAGCTARSFTERGGAVTGVGDGNCPGMVIEIAYTGKHDGADGSALGLLKTARGMGKNKVVYEGSRPGIRPTAKKMRRIRELSYKFLNTPYLWGARRCSASIAAAHPEIFKFFGVQLLRDAWQQASQGHRVDLAGGADRRTWLFSIMTKKGSGMWALLSDNESFMLPAK